MNETPFRPDLNGRTPRAFERGNPRVFGLAQGDPNATASLARIENRAEIIKAKAKAHHAANKETWIAREAIKLWKLHAEQSLRHPTPAGVARDVSPETLMAKARQNVHARGVGRMARVNAIKTRMQNAVVRNGVGQPSVNLSEVHRQATQIERKGPRN